MNKFSKLTGAVRTRKVSSGILTMAVIAAVLVANVVLYYLAGTFSWYIYKAETPDLSLSGSTEDFFAEAVENAKADAELGIASKVKINFCMAKEDLELHDPGKYVHETAVNLAAKHPELIEVEYVNIYTYTNSKGEDVDLDKYSKLTVGGEEVVAPILTTSVIFSYEYLGSENYKTVTDYVTSSGFSSFFTLDSDLSASAYNGEEIMAALVSWVLHSEHPTAYVTTGHGEAPTTAFTTMLVCAGYNVELVDLRAITGEDELKLNANKNNLLIISNPVTDFGRSNGEVRDEIEKLESYLSRGGRLYVSIDPYVGEKQMLNLSTLLAKYGIELSKTVSEDGLSFKNMIYDSSSSVSPDGLTVVAGYAANDMASKISAKTEKYGTGKILVREAAAINCKATVYATAHPLLVSSSSSALKANGEVVGDGGGYCLAAYSTVKNENGADGVIYTVSSAYFASTDVMITDGYSNKDFIYAVLECVFSADTPPYGCTPLVYNTTMLEGLTFGTANLITALLMIIPAALAVFGAVVIIKRKRR